MAAIKTLIIGLGNIGALYDIDDPSPATRTHLKALIQNYDFEIIGLIDPDRNKSLKIKNHYNLDEDLFYLKLDDFNKQIDLVVFAAPPNNRLNDLKRVSELGAKFCVFEKPLDTDLQSSLEIIAFCQKKSIQALVNFHRRYDPSLNDFHAQLPAHEIPVKVVVHYSKGIKNYGSHAIDLLISYFGDASGVLASYSNRADDPLIDGVIEFNNGVHAHLISHHTKYDLFDFEFFYTDQKFSLLRGTTERLVQDAEEGRLYKGYSHLSDPKTLSQSISIGGLQELYIDISKYFVDKSHNLNGCTLSDAKKGMEMIETLLKSAVDKRYIQL